LVTELRYTALLLEQSLTLRRKVLVALPLVPITLAASLLVLLPTSLPILIAIPVVIVTIVTPIAILLLSAPLILLLVVLIAPAIVTT
jgi:hypothetical protein